VAYAFVPFGLVMTFSVLSQAASQEKSVDPNNNKYSVKVLPFGIICLPKSAIIPLHSHPATTVFSNILFGSIHLKS